MLANELVKSEIIFVCGEKSEIAADYIRSYNYEVMVSNDDEDQIAEKINSLNADLVINDVLDTDVTFMEKLQNSGSAIINFEDMGEGAKKANFVINALYPHHFPSEKFLVGPSYFCLRDEFLFTGNNKNNKTSTIEKILLTFGGVDEGNITLKVLKAITTVSIKNNIFIEIVTGPGYSHHSALDLYITSNDYLNCSVIKQTKKISSHMLSSDLAFTSGGRTVLELSALEVPTVVICQNQRETTHSFSAEENGIINLGHRADVSPYLIKSTLKTLISDPVILYEMKNKMRKMDLSKGKSRVIKLINGLLS
jgi:spore coat polysaccharide biosynthesis predicted glycosyltransferase SpsG